VRYSNYDNEQRSKIGIEDNGKGRSKMNRVEKWRVVWERKGGEGKRENLTLGDLIAMDGFDKGAGKMTEETWLKVVEIVKREPDLKEGSSGVILLNEKEG